MLNTLPWLWDTYSFRQLKFPAKQQTQVWKKCTVILSSKSATFLPRQVWKSCVEKLVKEPIPVNFVMRTTHLKIQFKNKQYLNHCVFCNTKYAFKHFKINQFKRNFFFCANNYVWKETHHTQKTFCYEGLNTKLVWKPWAKSKYIKL